MKRAVWILVAGGVILAAAYLARSRPTAGVRGPAGSAERVAPEGVEAAHVREAPRPAAVQRPTTRPSEGESRAVRALVVSILERPDLEAGERAELLQCLAIIDRPER